jgi:hypothetical protein
MYGCMHACVVVTGPIINSFLMILSGCWVSFCCSSELNSDTNSVPCTQRPFTYKRFSFTQLQFLFLSALSLLPSLAVSGSLSFVNFCSGRVYYSLAPPPRIFFSFSFPFSHPFSSEKSYCRQRRRTPLRVEFVLQCVVVRGHERVGWDVKVAGSEGEHLR